MKVRVEELSPIERKLWIEVETPRVQNEFNRAYQSLSRQVKIAGFRPGKVPRRILEQRFKAQVQEDVLKRLVELGYLEAIVEHKIEAVSDPQVTNPKLTENEPFTFEARVEVKPKVDAKDYKGLALKKPNLEVPEEKVNEQLEQLRTRLSHLAPVEGRDVAAQGDFANADFEATVDGKPFPGSKVEGTTVEISPGELFEGHVPALEGLKVGDTREFDYAFPADFHMAEVKGKTAHYKFTLRGLKAKVVPALDDELAKESGLDVQTLDALKGKIREDLQRSIKQQAENEERDAVVGQLVEKNSFEVPRSMIDRTVDMMLQSSLQALARGGIDPRQLRLDFSKLREELRPRAEKDVKGMLLFEAVAEKEGLKASDEEVEKRIEKIAADSGQPLAAVKNHFRQPSERRGLSLRIREEKTLEFLKSQATYS